MAAGESAGHRAAASRAAAERYRLKLERSERSAEAWEKGEAGERAVAALLAPLSIDGYFLISDRKRITSDGNLDHVLVGPPGVVIVDAKNWTGTLSVTGRTTLRHNGRRRDSQLENLRTQAVEVAEALDNHLHGKKVDVWPVVCFVGEARIETRTPIDRVNLLDAEDLVPFIQSLSPVLDSHEVNSLAGRLLEVLPPRGRRGPSVPETFEPDEPVVFLHPWKKAGKNRLYVKTVRGEEVGYIDLASGDPQSDDAETRELMARLLPHYKVGAQEELTERTSTAPRGLRRLLNFGRSPQDSPEGSPFIAAYHWQGHGRRRLYVGRFDASGSRTELGWLDLDDGSLTAKQAGAAAVIDYCGKRFLAIQS